MRFGIAPKTSLLTCLEQDLVYSGFCLKRELTRDLRDLFHEERDQIMNLPSYGFDKFPDGPANRLHKYNIFKYQRTSIGLLKSALNDLILPPAQSHQTAWITGWFNLQKSGEHLGWHSHEEDSQTFLSGVLFLSDRRGDFLYHSTRNTVERICDEEGLICLFDSRLKHATDPARGTRLSVAFDIQIGQKKSDLWCGL